MRPGRVASVSIGNRIRLRRTKVENGGRLLLVLSLLMAFWRVGGPQAAAAGLFDSDKGPSEWRVRGVGEPRDDPLAELAPAPGRPGPALKVHVDFPGERTVWTGRVSDLLDQWRKKSTSWPPGAIRGFDWSRLDRLSLDVYVPTGAPRSTQLLVYLKDGELRWYQTLVPTVFQPGQWTTVVVDISDGSAAWSFLSHYRPWDGYAKQNILEVGLRFFSKGERYTGAVYVDKIEVSRQDKDAKSAQGQSESGIFDFVTNSDFVKLFEKFEITFNLPKTYSNPFDPDVVNVLAHFLSPSGQWTTVPGFFYQDYIRRASEDKQEILIPMGRSKWKIRFTPREIGTYRYFVEVNDGAKITARWRSFESLPSDNRGFVRVSAKDPSYFEFDNGEFFWPIGHNVCATVDNRAENIGAFQLYDEGTFAYDRYFDRMAENGETTARIWMASWWLAMEWTKRLYVHHNDIGRYSLVNAWRLDYLLEEAQKRGIYVMLTFTPHGHLTIQLESNWGFHPYNYMNGGFLTQPHSFFAHPEARRHFQQQLRYILARWGHCTNILCWELFNEIDLAEYYRTYVHTITEWIQKTAQFIRAHDQGRHLITSNLFHYRYGDPLYALPEIDFITAHVFNPDPLEEFKQSLQAFAKHGKPFYVTECEGHPFGSSPQQTENQMQVSLWGSYMLPMPGNAMPWWWVFIDERNLYPHFKALANFAKGEERRGKNLKYGLARFVDAAGGAVKGYAAESFQNDKSAMFWVYDRAALTSQTSTPLPTMPAVLLTNLAPGDYRIEIWDTYKGKVMDTRQLELKGDTLTLPLPEFDNDIAGKVKFIEPTPPLAEAEQRPDRGGADE